MKESQKLIEEAADAATKLGGKFYKNERGKAVASNLMGAQALYFFENWDDERMNFYFELHNRGFYDVEYRAPYNWKVQNSEVSVAYVEGDVYVTALDSTKL